MTEYNPLASMWPLANEAPFDAIEATVLKRFGVDRSGRTFVDVSAPIPESDPDFPGTISILSYLDGDERDNEHHTHLAVLTVVHTLFQRSLTYTKGGAA
jgi:hypothetical protein